MRDVHMLIRSCLFYYQFCASIPLQMGTDRLAAYVTRCHSARERPPTYHKIPPDVGHRSSTSGGIAVHGG